MVYADFLSGATCNPAIVGGAGPIGLYSTVRLVKSNFANPKILLWTIGSDVLNIDTK